MKIPLFYIDAFTTSVFSGNPAAVCLLDSWLPDEVLQQIATEHNLSETAFVVKEEKEVFQLKWFTPVMEVDLCGHATLAAAHVLYSIYDFGSKPIRFKTLSGILPVIKRKDGKLTLDFPAFNPEPFEISDQLLQALGIQQFQGFKSKQILIIMDNEKQITSLAPNFHQLLLTDKNDVIVSAPGNECDYVYRYFAPAKGVNEDPVTGSANSILVPYWSARLNKKALYARQLSARSGELWCQAQGDRVLITGQAITYMQGTVNITISHPDKLIPFAFE